MPSRFGFGQKEVSIMVGQTYAQPPIYAEFRHEPGKTVDIGGNPEVKWSGTARLPFSPTVDDAGKTFTVIATYLGVSRTLTIHVKAGEPISFGFRPDRATIRVGETLNRPVILAQFEKDRPEVDVSDRVIWDGLKTPFTPKSTDAGKSFLIKATLAGRHRNFTVNVEGPRPIAFNIEPAIYTMDVGKTYAGPQVFVQYAGEATMQDVTGEVTWSPSLPFKASARHAGRDVLFTATIGGVSKTFTIKITGTPVAPGSTMDDVAGEWRLIGQGIVNNQKQETNATLIWAEVDAAERAAILDRQPIKDMKEKCTGTVLKGSIKFDRFGSNLLVACVVGDTVEGRFSQGEGLQPSARFTLSSAKAARWSWYSAPMGEFDWVATKVVK